MKPEMHNTLDLTNITCILFVWVFLNNKKNIKHKTLFAINLNRNHNNRDHLFYIYIKHGHYE